MSLRSRLGKAAVIGGQAYVERFATSDEFAAIFHHGLDPESRRVAIEMVVRIAARARQHPPPATSPSRDARVKIRWTDELIARLRFEAAKSTDDFVLAEKLGLPPYCRGAMRAARSRYGLLRGETSSVTHTTPPRPPDLIAASGSQAVMQQGLCSRLGPARALLKRDLGSRLGRHGVSAHIGAQDP